MPYYVKWPHRLVADIVKRFKWSWQRITKGYADFDCWNMDEWIISVFPAMLDQLAERGCGSPEGLGEAEWKLTLKSIATHIRNASEQQMVCVNEFEEAYKKLLRISVDIDGQSGYAVVNDDQSENALEIAGNYRRRNEEIFDWRRNEIRTAFDMIGEHFFSLRD